MNSIKKGDVFENEVFSHLKKELEDDSSVNFYVAKNFDKYRFNFENSKDDIEPIFSSFNISLDKINEYGSSEE